MNDPEKTAIKILKHALSNAPDAQLIADITAHEIAAFVARYIITCPKCGATAWCDIDCDLCLLCNELINEQRMM
jgi:hypothetical protein